MKKFYCLLIASALSLFVQPKADSQISITSADLPNYFALGTSLFGYASSDTASMNVGMPSSSLNQSWTAPSVKITDSIRTDNVLPSSTPFSADFPGAVYAQKLFETDSTLTISNYYYFKVANDSVITMGFANRDSGKVGNITIDTTAISKAIKLFFPIPFQLGKSFTVSTDSTEEVGGLVEILSTVATADAYGTLALPKGDFGALRVSTVTSQKIYFGATLISNRLTYSMTWYTKEGYELSVEMDTLSSGAANVYFVNFIYPGKTPTTSVKKVIEKASSFALSQNYPNPFNPMTIINYQLPTVSDVTLKVYDILGNEVATLVNQKETAGSYSVKFDGSRLASGVYFYRLEAGNFMGVKKLVVMK